MERWEECSFNQKVSNVLLKLVLKYILRADTSVRKRRRKFGGNKKRNYTEGWVEFAHRRVAKYVATALNNTPIGGKKKSFYHDDLWNIKYLSKFRWTHLSEKMGECHCEDSGLVYGCSLIVWKPRKRLGAR